MDSSSALSTGLISRPHIVLALLCLALVAGIFYETFAPLHAIVPPPVVARPVPPQRALPVWTAPPNETYAAIEERFLFDSHRAAIGADQTVTDASGSPSPLSAALVGVIVAGDTRIAIFKRGISETSVPLGETIDGWKIVRVDPDRIVIRSGLGDRTILLETSRSIPGVTAVQTPAPSMDASQPVQGTPPAAQTPPAAGTPPANFSATQKALEEKAEECRRIVLATNGAAGITPAQCMGLVAKDHAAQ